MKDEMYQYNAQRWQALAQANALFTRPRLDLCVFRRHPDTDSGNIRTAFRNYPDSITAHPDTLSKYDPDSIRFQ